MCEIRVCVDRKVPPKSTIKKMVKQPLASSSSSSSTNWCLRLLAFGSLLVTLSVVYMATYMVFSPLSCHWSTSKSATSRRIALIADPQMEGDTKVYHQGMWITCMGKRIPLNFHSNLLCPFIILYLV